MDANEQDEIRLPHISREQALAVGGTLLASGAVDFAAHFNPAVILAGVVFTYAVGRLTPEVAAMLVPGSNPDEVVEALEKIAGPAPAPHPDQRALSKIKRLMHIKTPEQAQPKDEREEKQPLSSDEQENEGEKPSQSGALSEDDLFRQVRADDTGGVKRFTVEQICSHIEPNSYTIYIGRSLTLPNHPAVMMRIYKRHFRFMGASQRGKSSMVAAFLDIVTQTHDKKHVQLVLLDKEDQTSKLFAHLPHVVKLKIGNDLIKLHARNDEQVLEYLTYVVMIMNQRYTMSKLAVLELPILLVYIEEFLSLKNYFKTRMEKAKGADEKEKATADYRTLVYCIEEIAQRGLKVRVQLLLCAQVEYADDDFKEALVNVDCGMAFCVRPTAAAAAGFRNTELIKRNAKENKVGQAVVESPDCNDLVLSPDYDLEKRLVDLEKAEARYASNIRPLRPLSELTQPSFIARNQTLQEPQQELESEDAPVTVARNESALRPLSEPAQAAQNGASAHKYRLTDEQIKIFVNLYPDIISNKDRCLEKVGANTAYRAHANEIVQQYGLDSKRK